MPITAKQAIERSISSRKLDNKTEDLADVYEQRAFLADIASAHGAEFAARCRKEYDGREAELRIEGADWLLAGAVARRRLGRRLTSIQMTALANAGELNGCENEGGAS